MSETNLSNNRTGLVRWLLPMLLVLAGLIVYLRYGPALEPVVRAAGVERLP